MRQFTRREFLLTAATATASLAAPSETPEPVIDIHQHTDYTGRTDEQMIAHQRKMGVTHSVLLPAGRFFNLEAGCSGNDRVQEIARKLPAEYSFFANEVPYLSDARDVIRKALQAGGIGIGEQKFQVDADSRAVVIVAEIAKEFGVPVLLHFQFGRYNTGIDKFHLILEKFPTVNFIGHAQTWWANIDAKADQSVLYPKGPVTPGGITDRLLSDYPEYVRRHERRLRPQCLPPRRRLHPRISREASRQAALRERLQRCRRRRRQVQRRWHARSDPSPSPEQSCRAEDPLREREARSEAEGLTFSQGSG
jgi:predicted TIM-barrel fold metal-dependent hydrolase